MFELKQRKITVRGELTLLLIIMMNSFGVVLMLYSGSGITAISSVPYAFSEVLPRLSLGTWTYLFQSLLVFSLMVMRRKFMPVYLISFVDGFGFGIMMDVYEKWIHLLPTTLPLRVFYFILSYLIVAFGIALSNRCKMPIIPTDLFPREASEILHFRYSRFKISFDVTCLLITGILTWGFLGEIKGLGVGTVVAAFTMGKMIEAMGRLLDRKFRFVSVLDHGDATSHGRTAQS